MLEHQQPVDDALANRKPAPPMGRTYSADGKRKSAVVKSKIHVFMEDHYDYTEGHSLYIYIHLSRHEEEQIRCNSLIVMLCDS